MTEKIGVFISYSRGDDEPFVLRLYSDLTARGFQVWWDRVSLKVPGINFFREIKKAIAGCDRFVLVMGPKAIESSYVQAEWRHALFLTKEVVPVLRLENYETVPVVFRKLRCSDCRSSRPYNEALAELCQILATPLQ